MGGTGSGNHGGRPAVEDGLVLDLNRLIRQRTFRPGAWHGSIIWNEVYSGRETARIGYECFMGPEGGNVRLHYTVTNPWTDEKHHHDYTVQLVTTLQPFGGRHWWFVCPRRGDLVAKTLQAERYRPLRIAESLSLGLPMPAGNASRSGSRPRLQAPAPVEWTAGIRGSVMRSLRPLPRPSPGTRHP
jgi:hypothetical protein